ncbi:hypothetical protein FGO68_gene7753 [Halteria grandinella]|uniref:Uncharacterized protein n=1 Tax=Halteria grandinella TaxID=5974 RepID=A0A8J8NH22_HALGN|nr:hypothetical protein FGO68_gene7753 [Halteria grandinella]
MNSFCGKLINFLKACETFSKDPCLQQKRSIKELSYIFGQVFTKGVHVFETIRMSSKVFEMICRIFKERNENLISDQINRLTNILKSKKCDISIEILSAGRILAKLPKINIHQIFKSRFHYYDQLLRINQLERKDQYDEFFEYGTDVCLFVLQFLEKNSVEIIKDKTKQLRDVIVEAVQNIQGLTRIEMTQTKDSSLIVQVQQNK